MLNKLFYIYGIDTSALYTQDEMITDSKLNAVRLIKKNCKNRAESEILNKEIKELKQELLVQMHDNKDKPRSIRTEIIRDKNGAPKLSKRVSVFDSALVRCLGFKENEFNSDLIIIRIYYFDIAESIIKNGFYLDGEKYVFFSSSAGQIRTKKMVAIKESSLNKHWNELTAGLTIDDINAKGGMNVN